MRLGKVTHILRKQAHRRKNLASFVLAAAIGLSLAEGHASPLEQTWYAAGEHPVADKALPTITLENGKLTGTDSCNRLMGSYELRGKRSIRFKVASTMMACPDMTMANAFNAALAKARRYEIKDGFLVLRSTFGKQVLQLKAISK